MSLICMLRNTCMPVLFRDVEFLYTCIAESLDICVCVCVCVCVHIVERLFWF
jgi:hypothetical protein